MTTDQAFPLTRVTFEGAGAGVICADDSVSFVKLIAIFDQQVELHNLPYPDRQSCLDSLIETE